MDTGGLAFKQPIIVPNTPGEWNYKKNTHKGEHNVKLPVDRRSEVDNSF